MELPYQAFVAFRYLKSKKKQRGISLSTAISMGGVAVGVMALLIVLAVMSGFQEDLQKKILGVTTHLVVLTYSGDMTDYERQMNKIKMEPNVITASPFAMGQAMVASEGKAQGVYVRGILPELEINTTELESHMRKGSLRDLAATAPSTATAQGEDAPPSVAPNIILGGELADRLGVTVGDVVKVISPFGGVGPMGAMPKARKFRVAGIFDVGMFEYDSNLVLTSMPEAQEFFGMEGSVTGIEVKVHDIYDVVNTGKDLMRSLGYPYYTKNWIQMNRNLFAALKLEKIAMFVILTLIVIVAAFNIVSTQIMNVIEKQREIAILKAMGASRRGIMGIFMLQGFMIGLVGTIIGMTGGLVVCYLMNEYHIIKLPADVYYLSHLPARVNTLDFVSVTVAALVISFLATVYPAYQAAKLNPAEMLRYE